MTGSGLAGRRIAVATLVLLMGCGRGDAIAQNRDRDQRVQQTLGEVPAVVDTSAAAAVSEAFRAAAAKALPSVVTIQVTVQPQAAQQRSPFPFPFPFGNQGQGQQQQMPPEIGTGSGFVFDGNGDIVTNNHVVENAEDVQVRFPDGRVYRNAEVVGRDPNTDIAVVRIKPQENEKFVPLELGNSDALQVGDWVLALGNPLNLGFTVTAGIVSAKGRNLNMSGNQLALESYIQTDAAINRGNSGGPLVDLYGRVVGVNSAIYSGTGYYAGNGFAIPVALAAKAARDLIQYGVVRRPKIGVTITPVTDVQAELYHLPEIAGAVVSEVEPGSPAAKAGIQPEDVIVSLDGQPVKDATDLTTRLARHQPGDEVTLGVYRDGKERNIKVRLGQFEAQEAKTETASPSESPEQRLGFSFEAITPDIARQLDLESGTQGVVVTGTDPYSGAPVTRGDVVLEFDRKPVRSVRELQRMASDLKPGDIVVLKIRRAATGNVGVMSYRIR